MKIELPIILTILFVPLMPCTAAMKQLPTRTERSESSIAPAPVEQHIAEQYAAACSLDKGSIEKVLSEYRDQNSKWPGFLAHRVLLTAAANGNLQAQAELVKCFFAGEYGCRQNLEFTGLWLSILSRTENVAVLNDLIRFLEEHPGSYSYVSTLKKRIEEIEREHEKATEVPNGTTSSVDEKKIPVKNADGSLTDAFVNSIVEKRLNLMTSNNPTDELMASVFADEVLELTKSISVPRGDLVIKAQKLNQEWPIRAMQILNVGVSGMRIEVNTVFSYKNKVGKEIAAYNKITLLVNAEGKIVGMSENITAGNKPQLSPQFRKFPFSGSEKYISPK